MTVRAYFYLLAILLLSTGCTKNFDVEEEAIDIIQEFYASSPYPNGPSYWVKITVTGKIDGKARIYITPSARDYNPEYSMSFSPRDRKKIISLEIASKKNVIVYKPLTTKKGHLTIKIEYPCFFCCC